VIYTCCSEHRRAAVDEDPTLNGIDYLEVLDLESPVETHRQLTLLVRLLKPVPAGLTTENIRVDGGERIRKVGVEWVAAADDPPATVTPAEKAWFTGRDEPDHVLLVRTDSSGDHSTYRLRLVLGGGSDRPLENFDPRLSEVDFTFKAECPSDFDCEPRQDCSGDPRPMPDINYLARDFTSLRRVLVDRLGRQVPGWRDRSPADFATAVIELIAYLGDLQHYQLDATSTESYLRTARRRKSLRRHALLVDYALDEGCNARTWLHVEVSGSAITLPAKLRLYTRVPGLPTRFEPDSPEERAAREAKALVFETMEGIRVFPEHNEFEFYAWGDERCCLPLGATHATLKGHWPDLRPGHVLIFQEQVGPLTGKAADADPRRRHAVRLISARALDGADPLTDPLPDGNGLVHKITEITWHKDDALPFPLCVSSVTDEAHGSQPIDGVSVVLGNNVLADHGLTIHGEALGTVPQSTLAYPAVGRDPCERVAPEPLPPRFTPSLARGPVTRQGHVLKTTVENGIRRTELLLFDPDASATAALRWRTENAVPRIELEGTLDAAVTAWSNRRDLLFSRAGDEHFVLEPEPDGGASIRFGDDRHGRRPEPNTRFTANYRFGNGPQGNVGSDTIVHVVSNLGSIESVTNPLPARNGRAPEGDARARRHAPQAFRRQERAVTPEDYAEVTERLEDVQRAAASLRWTGSWHTVFDTVDREAGAAIDDDFVESAVAHLERFRMAGHDLKITAPTFVSLEIELLVCVEGNYFRSDVKAGLLEVLSSRRRRDGGLGLFHPDRFSFGQTVYLSPLYAAARTVPGVASVQVMRFQRQGEQDPKPLADGYLQVGRLEIPRLDNDPNYPEHGVLRLDLHGGK
jgi:hypothetical protein